MGDCVKNQNELEAQLKQRIKRWSSENSSIKRSLKKTLKKNTGEQLQTRVLQLILEAEQNLQKFQKELASVLGQNIQLKLNQNVSSTTKTQSKVEHAQNVDVRQLEKLTAENARLAQEKKLTEVENEKLKDELDELKKKQSEVEAKSATTRPFSLEPYRESSEIKFQALQKRFFQSERDCQKLLAQHKKVESENLALKQLVTKLKAEIHSQEVPEATPTDFHKNQTEQPLSEATAPVELEKDSIEVLPVEVLEETRTRLEETYVVNKVIQLEDVQFYEVTPNEAPANEASPVTAVLKVIDGIKTEVDEVEVKVRKFVGNTESEEFLHLREILIRCRLKLEEVAANGDLIIRQRKKELSLYIQIVTDNLVGKAESGS